MTQQPWNSPIPDTLACSRGFIILPYMCYTRRAGVIRTFPNLEMYWSIIFHNLNHSLGFAAGIDGIPWFLFGLRGRLISSAGFVGRLDEGDDGDSDWSAIKY